MKQKLTIKELIVRIAKKSGATKKQTAELFRVFPEVIESGLERDGEVRITGLGTFKLKWVKLRTARNLKTGTKVEVPAHNKVVFHPERSLKEKVNKDFKYLTYQLIEGDSVGQLDSLQLDKGQPDLRSEATKDQPSVVDEEKQVGQLDKEQSADNSEEVAKDLEKEPETPVYFAPEEPPAEPEPEIRKRKTIYWVIPLVFIIIAMLIVIFYMKNCQDELNFPPKEKENQEQVIQPSEPQASTPASVTDSIVEKIPEKAEEPPATQPEPPAKTPPLSGFQEQNIVTTSGQHLFQVAREIYGNPFLWALIYKDNREKINDPEELIPGTALVIPALEGTPSNLTRSDSVRVAEGFQMLYDYYSSKGDEQAKDFQYAMKSYTPK